MSDENMYKFPEFLESVSLVIVLIVLIVTWPHVYVPLTLFFIFGHFFRDL